MPRVILEKGAFPERVKGLLVKRGVDLKKYFPAGGFERSNRAYTGKEPIMLKNPGVVNPEVHRDLLYNFIRDLKRGDYKPTKVSKEILDLFGEGFEGFDLLWIKRLAPVNYLDRFNGSGLYTPRTVVSCSGEGYVLRSEVIKAVAEKRRGLVMKLD